MEYVYHPSPKAFVDFHAGTKDDPNNVSAFDKAMRMSPLARAGPANLKQTDQRAPENWHSSHKVRDFESVHFPEYKGWHSKSNPAPNEAWKWKYEAPKGYAIPTHVSRGPKLRVSENAGFAWDPSAAYGPETVQAMPNVDNKLKEDMFDESADQKFDGVPGTGVEHFGLSGMNTGTIAKSQHAALPPAPF